MCQGCGMCGRKVKVDEYMWPDAKLESYVKTLSFYPMVQNNYYGFFSKGATASHLY